MILDECVEILDDCKKSRGATVCRECDVRRVGSDEW